MPAIPPPPIPIVPPPPSILGGLGDSLDRGEPSAKRLRTAKAQEKKMQNDAATSQAVSFMHDLERQVLQQSGACARFPKLKGGILSSKIAKRAVIELLASKKLPGNQILRDEMGRLLSAATLIVCPDYLTFQWEAELRKHRQLKVVTVENGRDLFKLPLRDACEADIVLTTDKVIKGNFIAAGSSINAHSNLGFARLYVYCPRCPELAGWYDWDTSQRNEKYDTVWVRLPQWKSKTAPDEEYRICRSGIDGAWRLIKFKVYQVWKTYCDATSYDEPMDLNRETRHAYVDGKEVIEVIDNEYEEDDILAMADEYPESKMKMEILGDGNVDEDSQWTQWGCPDPESWQWVDQKCRRGPLWTARICQGSGIPEYAMKKRLKQWAIPSHEVNLKDSLLAFPHIRWHRIVVDDAHEFFGSNNKNTQASRRYILYGAGAQFHWAVSNIPEDTPRQWNRLLEYIGCLDSKAHVAKKQVKRRDIEGLVMYSSCQDSEANSIIDAYRVDETKTAKEILLETAKELLFDQNSPRMFFERDDAEYIQQDDEYVQQDVDNYTRHNF